MFEERTQSPQVVSPGVADGNIASEQLSAAGDGEDNSSPVRLMALAFDRVLERLPSDTDRSKGMDREIALLIVDNYRLGEHDPDRLSDLALAQLSPAGESEANIQLADPVM